jgi:hypothetical protein
LKGSKIVIKPFVFIGVWDECAEGRTVRKPPGYQPGESRVGGTPPYGFFRCRNLSFLSAWHPKAYLQRG